MSCSEITGEMSALNSKLTVERDDDLRYITGPGLIKLLGIDQQGDLEG